LFQSDQGWTRFMRSAMSMVQRRVVKLHVPSFAWIVCDSTIVPNAGSIHRRDSCPRAG
jgi:hypothetical protein